MGHASFKITTATGKVVLIDPWISGPTCPENCKTFDNIDLILATHGHSDHFSDVVALAQKHKPQIGVIFETGMWLGSKNVENVMPMSKGGTQKAADVEFTMVHANHSNSIMDDGKIIYGGEPAGFIVRLPGGVVVYHAGDTNLFGDMRLIGEEGITLAVLAVATRASAGTMFGALSNFDAVNDTGSTCNGFEIELDDIHSTDISYTYDWNHYGVPKITEDTTDPLHPKVFVRYESAKNPDGSSIVARPAQGTYCKTGCARGVYIGTNWSQSHNLSFSKDFRIHEAQRVTFRAEIFNIFNRANFNPPIYFKNVFDSKGNPIPSGGFIDKTQDPSRQIQFALRISF